MALHRFTNEPDGAYPLSSLVDVNGILYGTTHNGGSGHGTVYSITPGGSEKIIYRFKGASDGDVPSAGLTNINGVLYGAAGGGKYGRGVIFSVTTSGSERVLYSVKVRKSSPAPDNPLTYYRGKIYFTTLGAGSGDCLCGSLYGVTLNGTATLLHTFDGGSDGCLPSSGLLSLNGTLYGETLYGGGKSRCDENGPGGTVYTWTP